MRYAKACRQCRALKRRCISPGPSNACERCTKSGEACSLAPQATVRTIAAISVRPPQQSRAPDDQLLSDADAAQLVELYVYYIHDRPHSLFHLPSLRASLRQRTLPTYLLYAICAMGCRFSNDPALRGLVDKLMETSKKLTLEAISNISIELVQSMILLANVYVAHNDSATEAIFFSVAIRMMQIIQLRNATEDTAVADDIRKRIWWALYMADRWCSSGQGLPRQMDSMWTSVALPMEEERFQHLSPDQPVSDSGSLPGLWAHMATLVGSFVPIQDLNQQIVQKKLQRSEVDARVRALHAQLEGWQGTLPPHMVNNEKNLLFHQRQGTGGAFVSLHLGYYHYSTLLYFQYLDTRLPQSAVTTGYANRCKQLASSFSRFLHKTREMPGCAALYPTVAHICVVSSCVILHTLLFGLAHEMQPAKEDLEHNFEALIALKQHWPCVKNMIARLTTFQQQCLQSAEPQTHDLDVWMIRFLIEYALPFEDKPAPDIQTPGLTPESTDSFAMRGYFTTQALFDLGSRAATPD